MLGFVFTDWAIWKTLGIALGSVGERSSGPLCAFRNVAPPYPPGRIKAALMNTGVGVAWDWGGVDWERGCVMGRVLHVGGQHRTVKVSLVKH